MSVDQDLAHISDFLFQGTFFVYLVALIFSLVFYVRKQGAISLRRSLEVQAQREEERERALVGAAGATEAADTGGPGEAPAEHIDPARALTSIERMESRAKKAAGATQALVWLGIILHVATFITRGISAGRFPMGNLYEYVLGISGLTIIVAAVVIQFRRSVEVAWPWVLVPLLALMFYGGTRLYAPSAPVVPALQSLWLPIHVTTVSIGASVGIVSSVFSILYLLRVYQPQGKERGFLAPIMRPLPSARTLDEIAYRLGVYTLPILGLGIILGAIWASSAWGRPWGWDPKETFSFISWILYAAYLHARATAGWRVGAAWVNIVAMATMVFNLFFINLVVSGLHSYAGLN